MELFLIFGIILICFIICESYNNNDYVDLLISNAITPAASGRICGLDSK